MGATKQTEVKWHEVRLERKCVFHGTPDHATITSGGYMRQDDRVSVQRCMIGNGRLRTQVLRLLVVLFASAMAESSHADCRMDRQWKATQNLDADLLFGGCLACHGHPKRNWAFSALRERCTSGRIGGSHQYSDSLGPSVADSPYSTEESDGVICYR